MNRPMAAVLILAVSISTSVPQIAEAQLGGLIKKKVKDAVAKPESPAKPGESSAAAGDRPASEKNNDPTGFGSAIVEITQPNFDDFMRGLQTEIEAQAALKKEIARYGTSDEYEACKVRVAMSPEGKTTMDRMYNPPKGITGEDYIKLQTKVAEDMEAMTRKACPLDPAYWGPTRIAQSLDSIRAVVAESLMGGIDSQLYSIALERIERLCEYKGLGPGSADAKGSNPVKAGPLKFAGIGKDIYWLYTAGEVDVVNAANCKRYYALAGKLRK